MGFESLKAPPLQTPSPSSHTAQGNLQKVNQWHKHFLHVKQCSSMSLSGSDARIASGWKNKGDELFEKGDFEGAIGCYDKALEIFPRDPDLWNKRGLALNELRRYEEAIKSYDKALEHYPRETIVWNNKGVALDNAGNHIEAIRCFDAVIDIDPQDAGAWCNKGVSFGLLGWLNESVECFETAIDINPHHASSWYNKGITLLKLKHNIEANDAIARARELGFR